VKEEKVRHVRRSVETDGPLPHVVVRALRMLPGNFASADSAWLTGKIIPVSDKLSACCSNVSPVP
jgi:hypothetical protein